MNNTVLVERSDHWVLPLRGRSVTQCRVDYAFTLLFTEPDASYEIRIEGPFVLSHAQGADVRIDPDDAPAARGPALALLHQTVESAVAHKDGGLELGFADGSHIHVPASGQYEPWDFLGPAKLRIVSTPGGELTIWKAEEREAS